MAKVLGFGAKQTQPAGEFEAMVAPHLQPLYRLAYRFTQDPHAAEDLVQSLILKLLPQTTVLSEVADLRPWLSRALYNAFIDQTRRKSVSPVDLSRPDENDAALLAIVDEVNESPEAYADRALTRDQISEALLQLEPELRALLGWHDIEGYTLDEISKSQSIPHGTLKSRLYSARRQMREYLINRFAVPVRDRE